MGIKQRSKAWLADRFDGLADRLEINGFAADLCRTIAGHLRGKAGAA